MSTVYVFWLVAFGAGSVTPMNVVPVPYQTEQACEDAAKIVSSKSDWLAEACVPQPKEDVARYLYAYGHHGNYD